MWQQLQEGCVQKSFPSLRESLQISGGMVSRVTSDEQYSMEVCGLPMTNSTHDRPAVLSVLLPQIVAGYHKQVTKDVNRRSVKRT